MQKKKKLLILPYKKKKKWAPYFLLGLANTASAVLKSQTRLLVLPELHDTTEHLPFFITYGKVIIRGFWKGQCDARQAI